jgi:bifunctional non-homologous end joining protein LigD
MTTGGKGLHVITPLAATKENGLSRPAAKDLAHQLRDRMVRDAPQLYVINMAKRVRKTRCRHAFIRRRVGLTSFPVRRRLT